MKMTITKQVRRMCETLRLSFGETQEQVRRCKALPRGADRREFVARMERSLKGVGKG